IFFFFFSSRRRHTRFSRDWSSDVCSSDLELNFNMVQNLLLGEALFELNDDAYSSTVMDETYVLQPKKQKELFELFFILSPKLFRSEERRVGKECRFRWSPY